MHINADSDNLQYESYLPPILWIIGRFFLCCEEWRNTFGSRGKNWYRDSNACRIIKIYVLPHVMICTVKHKHSSISVFIYMR
jgi:hypothetical protein